ncbi:hypothetical protein HYU14_01115 [Candidatus Woesearchaeota archaeon]|nr:hypothetical protein [Candidatus Woesearchaeota archaeon]
MIDYETLLEKGFSKKDALRTMEVIRKAKSSPPMFKYMDALLYWALLVVAIVGNLIISIILLPFLLAFKNIPLYFTIILLGVLFGYIFNLLIRDVQHTGKEYIKASLFIPALAVINMYYMVGFANFVSATLHLPSKIHSPLALSLLYVIAFSLPYFLHNFFSPVRMQEGALA